MLVRHVQILLVIASSMIPLSGCVASTADMMRESFIYLTVTDSMVGGQSTTTRHYYWSENSFQYFSSTTDGQLLFAFHASPSTMISTLIPKMQRLVSVLTPLRYDDSNMRGEYYPALVSLGFLYAGSEHPLTSYHYDREIVTTTLEDLPSVTAFRFCQDQFPPGYYLQAVRMAGQPIDGLADETLSDCQSASHPLCDALEQPFKLVATSFSGNSLQIGSSAHLTVQQPVIVSFQDTKYLIVLHRQESTPLTTGHSDCNATDTP